MIQQVSQAISLQVERNSDQMIADLFDQNDLEEQLIVVAKNSERRSDVGLEQIIVQQQQIIENREENDVENKTDQQNEENFLNSNENVGQTKSKGLTPRALAKRAERAIKEAFQPTPKRSKKRRRLF
ncbi:hypothetical protein PVAND_014721 [Polypedilum vanderplanki]|uniref:Uncharacterized protein n=1 Tax=Polypedilum vanderplanki TaxID=319348 RepID=A0A9J6BAI5_POLVA|nr:hypothetical protein PVAND_014718 [Polypedilum vanderplanki]KAG5666706.1 hypothetical protein PVAND_014721 [Polypedilum vanderplanki]